LYAVGFTPALEGILIYPKTTPGSALQPGLDGLLAAAEDLSFLIANKGYLMQIPFLYTPGLFGQRALNVAASINSRRTQRRGLAIGAVSRQQLNKQHVHQY
jgi:hypothetical protein